MKVKIAELEQVVIQALHHYGYTEDETAQIAQVLLYAQLRDNNQGIAKLVGQGMPRDPEAGEIRTERETKLSALLDGNRNAGMIVVAQAVKLALAKAQEHGFGLAGTYNTNTSTGATPGWAEKIFLASWKAPSLGASPNSSSIWIASLPEAGTPSRSSTPSRKMGGSSSSLSRELTLPRIRTTESCISWELSPPRTSSNKRIFGFVARARAISSFFFSMRLRLLARVAP